MSFSQEDQKIKNQSHRKGNIDVEAGSFYGITANLSLKVLFRYFWMVIGNALPNYGVFIGPITVRFDKI